MRPNNSNDMRGWCIFYQPPLKKQTKKTRIYVSVDGVSISSDNGLLPISREVIISTNAWLLSIGPLGTNFNEISIKKQKLFTHENASENIVWKIAAILSRGRWVKTDKNLGRCSIFMSVDKWSSQKAKTTGSTAFYSDLTRCRPDRLGSLKWVQPVCQIANDFSPVYMSWTLS